ncbi:MAG: hypothetical protein R3C97_11595 [Geminicoccaceae bacterium]
MLQDCRGLAVTTGDRDAIEKLDRAHEQFLCFSGDPLGAVERVIEAAPDMVMAHCFRAGLLAQAMETRIYDDLLASVEAAEALATRANDRERGHIAALRRWVDGDFFAAVQIWEDVLTHYPMDLFALQQIHLSDVLLGDVVGQRDSVARVFPLWDEQVPGYEFLLGFYSFGLEENRDFGRAEEYGRRCGGHAPGHPMPFMPSPM